MTSNEMPGRLLAEVRAEMARQDKRQAWLADRLGVTQPTVQRRLSGRSPMTLPELLSICDALGVSLATLASRAEQVAA